MKLATEMTDAEYEAAKAAAIRGSPGLSAAELADLASRRGDGPKNALEMTDAEYERERAKLIRGN